MKEAYIKGIKIINSCTNIKHILATYNYLWNFKQLFKNENGSLLLTKKLYERCYRQRQKLREEI